MERKVRLVLSDGQWKRIEKLCVGKPEDPGGTGADNRMFAEAVLWIARTGSPWRALPPILPADRIMGDAAYDADHFRQDMAAVGAEAVIPCHPSRASKVVGGLGFEPR